jgi:uncharacterized protein YndB with AHSA1/START domain
MTSPGRTGVTTYDTPSDREFRAIRVVDAPRELAFAAWTKPEHMQKWLLGPEGWTMPICEVDLRVGGTWRFGWRKGDGTEMTMSGTYKEVVPPERLVSTERWGPEWPETINTVVFTESGGKTTITLTVTYPTKKDRDQAMATGMKDGMEASYARYDALLKGMR